MVRRGEDTWLNAKQEFSRRLLGPRREARSLSAGLAGVENIVGVGIEDKLEHDMPTGETSLKVYVVEKLPEELIDPQSFVQPESL